MSKAKDDFIARTLKFWNPGKTLQWRREGIDLVIDRREGYFLHDMDGGRLIDCHLNGGTYSLGHRNPEIIAALKEGLEHFDIGNHHFPSIARTMLAEKLAEHSPEELHYSMFASGGGEAIDIALKSARHATKRRRLICLQRCYHGHTGLAVKVGDDRFSKLFLSEAGDEEVTKVPFNDLDAMERAIMKGDAACVIIETIPATYGFPLPKEAYLKAIKAMCEKTGTLFIADEVQTGLMRSGKMWCFETYGIVPDMLVTGKGLSGGIYPIAAVVANERSAAWLKEDGWGHMSSFGGAELGCVVAAKVLDICARRRTQKNGREVATQTSGRSRPDPGEPRGFLRRHSPARADHGAGIRSPRRREIRHARLLRERDMGDLFRARPARAAIQAGAAAGRRALRRNSGASQQGSR